MMTSFLQATSDLISRHHEWAGVVLGATTFLESLVLIGAFVPATALMLVAGGLIAAGVLDPLPVLFACIIGAVLGDAVSFMLGRRLGGRVLQHPVLAPHRRRIALTRLLCRRYGVISVFAARFLGPIRALAPLVLGAVRMRRRTFQAANVVSAIIWVPIMLAPGYLGAKGLAQLELLVEADHLTIVILAGVAAAVALLAVFAVWRLNARRAARAPLRKPAIRRA
jgi:membrane protein DedA with SNARE-associated domain